MAHVDEEAVEHRLRRAHHVFRRHNVLDGAVVELRACPAVARLVALLVPVEHLQDLVAHGAERAPPVFPAVDELHEGIDV